VQPWDKFPNKTREIIIKIQRRIREFLRRRRIERMDKRLYNVKGRKILYSFKKKVECQGSHFFNVQLIKVYGDSTTDVPDYYTLTAQSSKKTRNDEKDFWVTPYKNIRLPEDPTILRYFMEQAVIIKVDDNTFRINHLSLHRMKIRLYNEF